VNLANLTLARGAARARDVAIRVALGARQRQLVLQVFMENFIIAILGGLCGLGMGYVGLGAMVAAIPSTGVVPAETTITMDPYVWCFGLALTIASGIAFGLPPALGATRVAVADSLKEESPAVASGRSQRRFRRGIVVAEVAAAFILLATAGLLIQSVVTLNTRMTTGFDSGSVLTAGLPIPAGRFRNATALNSYLDQIATHIQTVPGVRDVAFTEGLPTQGTPFLRSFQVTDQPVVDRSLRPYAAFKVVSASYFRAVGLRILEGRALNDSDRAQTPLALDINETFARTYFAGADPIGKRLLVKQRGSFEKDALWEVVGVVADEGLSPWTRAPEPMLYATREQDPSDGMALAVRGAVDSVGFQRSVQHAVSEVDRDQALTNVQLLTDLESTFIAPDRLRSMLLAIFAAIAASLAAMGLYGVLSHAVVQRTHEIGVRAALGATRANLIALVVGQGMAMTAYGLMLGLGGVIVTGRLLTKLLVGVEPLGQLTIASIAGLLTVVALLACYAPARRAAGVDPLMALRYE
jgi:putative ABC transport system permease protein